MNDKVVMDTLTPKGRVGIKLYDASGELQQEVETDNFISKGMEAVMKLAMANAFKRSKARGATGDPIVDILGNATQLITLTTAEHDESPQTEWYAKGDLIGMCQTDLAIPGDTLNGTYNTVESYITENKVHIVCDFATSAANGTIGSVYVGTTYMNNIIKNRAGAGLKRIWKHNIRILHFTEYKGKYYAMLNVADIQGNPTPTVVAVFNGTLNTVSGELTELKRYNIPDLYAQDMTIRNDIMYFATTDTITGYTLAQLDDDIHTNPIVTDVPMIGNRIGLIHNQKTDQFVRVSNGKGEIMDKDFGLLSVFNIFTERIIYFLNNYCIAHVDGDTVIMSQITYSTSDTAKNIGTPQGSGITIVGVIGDNIIDENGYVYPKMGFTSRAKMSSPVTKTSVNTMKVTYDYELPSIYG